MSGYLKSHWNYNHSLASLDPSLLCFSLMTKWVISMLLCCSLATIYWHAHTMWTHIWLSVKQHMHTLLTQIRQCTLTYSTVSNYPHTLYTHVDKVIFYAFKCKHSRMTHTCTARPLSLWHKHSTSPQSCHWSHMCSVRQQGGWSVFSSCTEFPNQTSAQWSRRKRAANSESVWKTPLCCCVLTAACVPNLLKFQTSCTLATKILQHHFCWFGLFAQCKDSYFLITLQVETWC